MNIQGGGISFEISGTNDKLLRILEQSKSSMQNFSGEVKKGGKDIDSAFNAITSSIAKARADLDKTDVAWTKTYENMTQKLEQLKAARQQAWATGNDAEFGKLNVEVKALERQIAQWEKIGQEIRNAYDELGAEEAAMKRQYEEATKVNNAAISITQQYRKARAELQQMVANGQQGTEAYAKQRDEVIRLQQAMAAANKQAKNLANPNRNFQAVIGGLTLMTSGYQAVTGAMGLFAGENENLQRIMTKVQSVMSITMALQTAYTQLNKNSAFQLVIVAKAKDMLTAANARLATALGISTAAASALMATLTLGLSAAITGIIYLISKMSGKADEAKKSTNEMKKAFEEYHTATATNSANLVGKFQQLRFEYQQLKTAAEKTEWIKANQSAFNGLELAVNNVTDADNIFVNNTTKVVKALELRAKAMALQELQMKAYEQYYKEVINADSTVAGGGYYHNVKEGQRFGTSDGKLPDDWVKAGVTATEAGYKWGGGQSGAGSFTLTKTAVDKINAYRIQQARQTNSTIHKEAQAELDKTLNYVTNELKLTEKEIKELGILSAGSGNNNKQKNSEPNKGDDKKDEYAEQLATRKKLYAKYLQWKQSADETVRNAADTEFAALLKEGSSYIDYLERQRDSISDKAKKTAEDLRKLQFINNEIAETTKQTVLSDFNKKLQEDLAACKTIGEMLDVIERRKAELKNDNSDTDNAEAEILSNAENDLTAKAKEETAQMLQEYASYLNEKILFEEAYARRKELLTKKIAEASTEQERAVAEAALAGLERKRKEYEQRSASERYDELKEQYKTYQQQISDIQTKFREEREEAQKQGNLAMIAQINAKEQAEISKLAAEKLKQSESWNQLFSDLSTLSSKTINKLLADINSQKVTLSAQFNPADLKAINEQLEKAKDELHKRNPFLALKDSLKELRAAMNADKLLRSDDPFIKSLEEKKKQYKQYTEAVESDDETLAGAAKEAYADLLKQGSSYIDYLRRKIEALNGKKITIGLSVDEQGELEKLETVLNKETGATKTLKEGLKDTFASVSSTIDFIGGTFDSVVSGMKKMGISMDEETEHVLGDISDMMGSASQLASGIATGNPLSIIQGSVGFLSSAFDLFNSRDRKAEKSIKQHEKAVTRLGRAYTALQHEVDKALGETVYQNQSAMIRNLRQQQVELRGMINDEKGKKKTDWDRIEEWEEKIAEASREIEDIIAEITKSITQTDAKTAADELGDALVEAFSNGTSAAKAFDKVSGDILRNAVINALKVRFLEQPLQDAIKSLQHDMGFDAEGNGRFDGLTEAEQKRFRDSVAKAGANFAEAFKVYEDLFNELNEKDPSTLSGAIKGASQESIDLLAGQANAVRMNQVTSLDLLRQQLTRLSNIDANVGVIASRLLAILNRLTAPADDGLRGHGITD